MRDNLPLCVLVGRTNVGKSTLFNLLVGERVAIVDPTPGVTRDWIERVVSVKGLAIRLVDTGGISLGEEGLQKAVEERVWRLVDEAQLVLFLVDGRVPLTRVEAEVIATLRRKQRPFFVVVNKREGLTHESPPPEILELAGGKVFQISAKHGDGIARLKEAIFQELKEFRNPKASAISPSGGIPVAIVGKPNVGKSTLFNSLLGEERAIVSPVPGTTRDAVEAPLRGSYGYYLLVDTAGLPRRKNIRDRVTLYATFRTTERLADAELCLLVLDPFQGVTRQDRRIAREIAQLHKCCIVFVNKVDALLVRNPNLSLMELCERARVDLPALYYAAFRAGSALDASLVRETLLPLMAGVVTRFHQTVREDVLRGRVREKIRRQFSMLPRRRKPSLEMLLQQGVAPPHFLAVVEGIREKDEEEQCLNIIEKVLREEMDWEGVPLRITVQREGERVPQSVLELSPE
uniref:GTPase Der n=1 Tax=Candidatus Caldatribacterium saccharofermentans TaxID=1454753 RepID=A0A7V4TEC9_9BACT